MFDLPQPLAIQRSKGRAFASFGMVKGRTKLVDLAQAGSAKLMLPRLEGDVPEAVFLNTSGGLTGGDRISFSLQVGDGVRLTASTQTAERAYASNQGAAQMRVQASVGAGGRLDWLPQETILYQACNLQRRTEIDLAETATCLTCESLVLGRVAMGETLTSARLHDHRMIRRAGRPVWSETFLLDDALLARRDSPALLAGATALGLVALVAQGAEDATAAVLARPSVAGARLAASGWDGRCLVRVLAPDGLTLRKQMAQIIMTLSGRPLPRVWLSGGTL